MGIVTAEVSSRQLFIVYVRAGFGLAPRSPLFSLKLLYVNLFDIDGFLDQYRDLLFNVGNCALVVGI